MKIRYARHLAASAIAATTLLSPIAAELAFAPVASAAPCEVHRHAHHIGAGFSDVRHGDDWGTAPHRRGHGGTGSGDGSGDGDIPGDHEHSGRASGVGHGLGNGERRERHHLAGRAECAAPHETGLGRRGRHGVENWLRDKERHERHKIEHGHL